jgi:hypothetical protein
MDMAHFDLVGETELSNHVNKCKIATMINTKRNTTPFKLDLTFKKQKT